MRGGGGKSEREREGEEEGQREGEKEREVLESPQHLSFIETLLHGSLICCSPP